MSFEIKDFAVTAAIGSSDVCSAIRSIAHKKCCNATELSHVSLWFIYWPIPPLVTTHEEDGSARSKPAVKSCLVESVQRRLQIHCKQLVRAAFK
jgi:hypothetical protein